LILNPRWRQLGERVLERATRDLAAEMIPCGVSHGDFVPWNTRRQDGCLFVFDWESASWDAPLLADIFHFHTQVAIVLGGPQRASSNWAPSPSADPRATQALLLLLMLDSACSVAKEGSGSRSRAQHYRHRLIVSLLQNATASKLAAKQVDTSVRHPRSCHSKIS